MISDLGGAGDVTAAQRALVEAATRTKLYIDSIDAWLMERETLIHGRRAAVFPAVRERQALVDSLLRVLMALGLERKARPVQDLNAYVAQNYGVRNGGAESTTTKEEKPCPPPQSRM